MKTWMVVLLSLVVVAVAGCKKKECPPAATPPVAPAPSAQASTYLDSSGRDDELSGGSRYIPITTKAGTFNVWVKRTGNNPRIKVLLLHGGPGATHEYFQAFDSYFPKAEIEYYFYDQLESGNSDHPDKPELWEPERYADEVEQIRVALGLDKSNFYLLGHSWGGIVAIEYALAHQDQLKGLIISNMMSSAPAYNKYAHEVLMPQMDPKVLAEAQALEAAKKYDDPRYEELLFGTYYVEHILRMPVEKWPDGVVRAFGKLNKKLYIALQGPSEMGVSGRLENWDRTADLSKITVPTLVIGASHDTMDPEFMEKMSTLVQHGRFLLCPNGSHLAMYDDQKRYFDGLLKFLGDVDRGAF
jgi:proline iminopeptidase